MPCFASSAIDHVTDRDAALSDFSRVLGPRGRAIISASNFHGLTARLSRKLYAIARRVGVMQTSIKRCWDPPIPEHTFEGTYDNLVALGSKSMSRAEVYGVSLFFGLPRLGWLLAKLPKSWANRLLRLVDRIAHGRPAMAEVVVCVLQQVERDRSP